MPVRWIRVWVGGCAEVLPVEELRFRLLNTCVNGATTGVTVMLTAWLNRSGVLAFSTMFVAVDPVPTVTSSEVVVVSTWTYVPDVADAPDRTGIAVAPAASATAVE